MTLEVAASIRARLLNQARARGEEFEFTLTRFASERLLFRLGASTVRDRCILKGACLLSVWLADPYRATRDVDILAFGPADDAGVRSLVAEICAVACPEDGLHFDLSDLVVEPIRPEEEYSGMRARFRAWLGSARISVQLDIGVGDAVVVSPDHVTYPTMLATLPAPRVLAYPKDAAIAEKFEAMVKLGTRNSRLKDFHDVWALANGFTFDGPTLRKAVAGCFERRATSLTSAAPSALTRAFYQLPELEARWRSYLAKGAVLVAPPAQFEVIGELILQFLGPVRASIVDKRLFARTWEPGGPWRSSDAASTAMP